ncbi:AraC family transcriptional regulator [Sphingomonas sp. So64.6b]|nr:AraC family transcriptional regulator [Sphingomonas sp. So64.6b]
MMSAVEHFSTRLVPPQERQLFWRGVVADTFPGMTAYASEGIRADLDRWSLGDVGLARAQSGRAHISRIAIGNEANNLIFHLQRRGRTTLVHGDETITAGVGDIIIADDARPYSVEISEFNDCLILQVPAALLGPEITRFDLHGRLLSVNDPNVAFLNHLLLGLWGQREMFDRIDDGIGGLLADAARIACGRSGPRTMKCADASPVEFALRNLGDPALGTAMICDATGLSARAVQKAFVRKAALTPTAFITTRRLARAADLLACPDGRSVTDIAFEVGFNDSAFFSRCFRRSYGVTPSQWRARSPGGRA